MSDAYSARLIPGKPISYTEWLEIAMERDWPDVWRLHELYAREHKRRDASWKRWIDLGGEG